jgi:hypothetical protein
MENIRPEQMHRWNDNAELKSIQGVKREGHYEGRLMKYAPISQSRTVKPDLNTG